MRHHSSFGMCLMQDSVRGGLYEPPGMSPYLYCNMLSVCFVAACYCVFLFPVGDCYLSYFVYVSTMIAESKLQRDS